MASRGYPEKYEKGFEISLPGDLKNDVYVAGAILKDGKMVTSGGRVLGVTAVEEDLRSAVRAAYTKAERIGFANAYYRKDIGARALQAEEA